MSKQTKNLVICLVLIALITNGLFFAVPKEARAQVTTKDVLAEWGEALGTIALGEVSIRAICVPIAGVVIGGGNILGGLIDTIADGVIDRAIEWGKEFLGIGDVFSGDGIPVNDPTTQEKVEEASFESYYQDCVTFLRNVVLATYKKRLLDHMTDETVKWIQGGGDPKFITSPEKFYENAFQEAVGDMILQTKLAPICYEPLKFKLQIQLMQPVFSQRVSCTLDNIVKNIGAFKNDFKTGGWIAYQESLKLQNTPAGISLLTQDELLRRQDKKSETAQYEATVGLGFLGDKRCNQWKEHSVNWVLDTSQETADAIYANCDPIGTTIASVYYVCDGVEAYYSESPDGFQYTGKTARPSQSAFTCTQPETITPGRVVAESMTKAINSEYDFIINANDLSTYGAAILDAMINRVMKKGVGLARARTSQQTEEEEAARTCADLQDPWLIVLCEQQGGITEEMLIDIVSGNVGRNLREASSTLALAVDEFDAASSTSVGLITTLTDFKVCLIDKGFGQGDIDAASSTLDRAHTRTGAIDQALTVDAPAFQSELDGLWSQFSQAEDTDDFNALTEPVGNLLGGVTTFESTASDTNTTVQALLEGAQGDLEACESI